MTSLAWIIPLSIWFLFILLVVPYRLASKYSRQRDEARHAIEELSPTPLFIECDSSERRLVGETCLKEQQWRWLFRVTLTNKDDKNSIRTDDISLEVRYPVTGGKVKSYKLSLIPDADKDKYKDSFWLVYRPLLQNECLGPTESIHGLYQFLDTKGVWKPIPSHFELNSGQAKLLTPILVVDYTLLFNQILIRKVFRLD
jgi:hypothetical protein